MALGFPNCIQNNKKLDYFRVDFVLISKNMGLKYLGEQRSIGACVTCEWYQLCLIDIYNFRPLAGWISLFMFLLLDKWEINFYLFFLLLLSLSLSIFFIIFLPKLISFKSCHRRFSVSLSNKLPKSIWFFFRVNWLFGSGL